MIKTRGGRILYFLRLFYPIQLIFGHLKYNLLALIYWLLLFLIASDSFGVAFGIPFLFYSPEYQGEISWISFGLLGFALGGFTMAFNLYSYMVLGTKYPFLATLSRPFIKFCLNNALIPIVFLVYFIIQFSVFQVREEFATSSQVVGYVFSFLIGFLVFVFGSILYFFPTNKDFFKLSGRIRTPLEDEPMHSFLHKEVSWSDLFTYEKDRSYIYMSGFFSWKYSRSVQHYDRKILKQVYKQNHINASLFELVTIGAFFVMGMFRELPVFSFPPAMSIVLLLAILLMIFSIFKSWFNYWTYPILIAGALLINYLSVNSSFFHYRSYAYGLNYDEQFVKPYSVNAIFESASNHKQQIEARQTYIDKLENWKKQTGEKKPKLVIVISSGGGSRSAYWTFSVLQKVDGVSDGKLMKNTHLITGASGGMIGAAYFRELALRDQLQQTTMRHDSIHRVNIGKDLLHKLSVSAYSNDLFVRYQTLKYRGNQYTKDRGYAFEQHVLENTGFVMDHPLSYYKKHERNAVVPSLVFTPTIANDGRRLVIGSESLSFLCYSKKGFKSFEKGYENVDYHSFFGDNTTDSTRFSSVLRMSATFPFVLPMVSMPTSPEMQIMDAGVRDNYGGKWMIEFLYEMEDWINENTSGVVVVQVRDTKKILDGRVYKPINLKTKFTMPFGNMFDNFPQTQDFDQDALLKIGFERMPFSVDMVTFNLRETADDRISLSWHLTTQEKLKIENAFQREANQRALQQLMVHLDR